MSKTSDHADGRITASELIKTVGTLMKDDPAFEEFVEDGNAGADFYYFDEDVTGLGKDPDAYGDDLLHELYNFADEERIWLG